MKFHITKIFFIVLLHFGCTTTSIAQMQGAVVRDDQGMLAINSVYATTINEQNGNSLFGFGTNILVHSKVELLAQLGQQNIRVRGRNQKSSIFYGAASWYVMKHPERPAVVALDALFQRNKIQDTSIRTFGGGISIYFDMYKKEEQSFVIGQFSPYFIFINGDDGDAYPGVRASLLVNLFPTPSIVTLRVYIDRSLDQRTVGNNSVGFAVNFAFTRF